MNKVIADIKDLFVSKKNTDVTIQVKEETFSAHRCILAARSSVFAAMFRSDMTEKETGFIDVPDCDPEAFNHFLMYLYSGEINYGKCNFFHLYKIADKYDMPELKQVCVDSIIKCLSVEKFCETYVFGDAFDEKEIITFAQNFFIENFEKIVSSGVLLSLMKEDCYLVNNLFKAVVPKVKMEKKINKY